MTIKLWDTNDDWKNTKTLYGHDHSVSAVKFMPGDDFLISAGRDRSIRVWDVKTGYVVLARLCLPEDSSLILKRCPFTLTQLLYSYSFRPFGLGSVVDAFYRWKAHCFL
jgi:platelet-activating factor acetylhydrolase IB subunit alpha